MFKIDHSSAVSPMPTPSAVGTQKFFGPHTVVTHDIMNALMMEIANAVTGGGLTLDKTSQTQLLAAITKLSGGPVGSVHQFAMNAAPTGYLECDGSAVSRSTYADLFAAIGTTFGPGNGTTTFNLPDMRGYFPRGWDHGRGIDNGRTFGSSQADEFKSHDHNVPQSLSNSGSSTATGHGAGGVDGVNLVTTDPTGGAETRPKNVALLYAIKF